MQIKNTWNQIKKRKITISIIAAAIILIIGYFSFGKNENPEYNTASAKRGTIIQEVSATGRVKAAKNVDLAFEKTGKISRIYVEIKDSVKTGQILATLNNDDIYAQLLQAQAGVESAQASLDELKKGTRQEDIEIAKSDLEKSKQDLSNYYSGAIDILNDSYAKADDAVRKQTDALFSNDETNTPRLTFNSGDSQAQTDSQWQRILARDSLNDWKLELDNLKNSSTQNPQKLRELTDESIKNSKQRLSSIRDFLSRLAVAVENMFDVSSATIDAYKTGINAARTAINAASSNIGSQEQLIASQKITIEKIQNQLNLKLAGSTPEQIASQEAQVRQAEANVKNYEAQLEKTIIRSPFNGIVTRQDAKVGEIAVSNTPVISVISNAKFEIEANIPEVDIAKIKINDISKTTLDAYGNDTIFETRVIKIDPAETIIEGVATYKVTLQFSSENELIKSGMTANLDILTAKRENVIYIPQRTVKINDRKIVKILNTDGTAKEVLVETGLRGSDGNIEIISGISEGDTIIISEK